MHLFGVHQYNVCTYFTLLLKSVNLHTNHLNCGTDLPPKPVYESPCSPSPCGPNAVCKEHNEAGSCSCIPEYFGNPYEGCHPECIINTDCSYNKACVNNKCRDPCPGSCGTNAVCQVINHNPSCTCIPGYTGDPFRSCILEMKRKYFVKGCIFLLFGIRKINFGPVFQ